MRTASAISLHSPPSSAYPLRQSFSSDPAPHHNSDSNTNSNAHFFQPPTSPALTLTTPSHTTSTDYFAPSTRSRPRPDLPQPSSGWTLPATPDWPQCPTPSDGSSYYNTAYAKTSALVNERYSLKGGLDTPGLQALGAMESLRVSSTGQERRWRGDTVLGEDVGARSSLAHPLAYPLARPLERERNGVPRLPESPNGESRASWTGLAFNLIGKVFEFGSTVFRGFHAGGDGDGGGGYDVGKESGGGWGSPQRCSTPLPGSWHHYDDLDSDDDDDDDDDDVNDYEHDVTPPLASQRPSTKRRQTDRDTWVLVTAPAPEPETSPKRKVSTTNLSRPSSSAHIALHARSTASRGPSRRSLAPLAATSRRHSSHQTPQYSPQQTFRTPGSGPHHQHRHERRASFAPLRSPSRPSTPTSQKNSQLKSQIHTPIDLKNSQPQLTPEPTRYLKRRSKHDRQTDAAVSEMTRKLAEMVRQGQVALGTRFDVEEGGVEDDEDEDGFEKKGGWSGMAAAMGEWKGDGGDGVEWGNGMRGRGRRWG